MTPPYLRPISAKAFTKYNDQQCKFVCLLQDSDWLYDLQVKIGDTNITAVLIGSSFTLVRYGQPSHRNSEDDWHLVQWRDENGKFL